MSKINNFLIAYGTLRKDQYNYNRMIAVYGPDSMRYIKTMDIQGYAMYDLGFYPAIHQVVDTVMKDWNIVVDLFEVSDRVWDDIYLMETGAGYDLEFIGVENNQFGIYVMNYEKLKSLPLIKHGDWLKVSKNQTII